jgi:hypothetical protein
MPCIHLDGPCGRHQGLKASGKYVKRKSPVLAGLSLPPRSRFASALRKTASTAQPVADLRRTESGFAVAEKVYCKTEPPGRLDLMAHRATVEVELRRRFFDMDWVDFVVALLNAAKTFLDLALAVSKAGLRLWRWWRDRLK